MKDLSVEIELAEKIMDTIYTYAGAHKMSDDDVLQAASYACAGLIHDRGMDPITFAQRIMIGLGVLRNKEAERAFAKDAS